MKILIIGSKGFIGSNAVSFFTGKKYDVWKCGVSDDVNDLKYFKSAGKCQGNWFLIPITLFLDVATMILICTVNNLLIILFFKDN